MAVAIKEETKNSSNLQVIKGKRLSESIGRSKYSSNKWEEKNEAGKSIGKESEAQRQEWLKNTFRKWVFGYGRPKRIKWNT